MAISGTRNAWRQLGLLHPKLWRMLFQSIWHKTLPGRADVAHALRCRAIDVGALGHEIGAHSEAMSTPPFGV